MFFIIYALICVQQVIIIPIKKNKKVVLTFFYYYKILDNILDSSLLCLQISFLYYEQDLKWQYIWFFLSYFIMRKKISIKIIILQDDRHNDNIDTNRERNYYCVSCITLLGLIHLNVDVINAC